MLTKMIGITMTRYAVALMVAISSIAVVGGCAQLQTPPLGTGPITTGATPPSTTATPKRLRPVVANRPARMYVFAGFKEKDCSPVPTTLAISTQPAQGKVEFRKGQTTTVMQSASGKCIGTKITGTGVYYTANAGASGPDTFAVTATTASGTSSTKTFSLNVTP